MQNNKDEKRYDLFKTALDSISEIGISIELNEYRRDVLYTIIVGIIELMEDLEEE